MKYIIIVLYKYKELTKEQEEKAKREWEEIKKNFPKEITLICVANHAFGTDFNGFLILETENFETYIKFWKWFKDEVRWYIEKTQTIIGVKRE